MSRVEQDSDLASQERLVHSHGVRPRTGFLAALCPSHGALCPYSKGLAPIPTGTELDRAAHLRKCAFPCFFHEDANIVWAICGVSKGRCYLRSVEQMQVMRRIRRVKHTRHGSGA